MKTKLLLAISTGLFLVLAYTGSVLYVGSRVEIELATIETALVANDEIIVRRFDYESHLLSGLLSYDLEWSPAPGTPLFEAATLAREANEDVFRIAGTADLTYGPWVGGSTPFSMARLEAGIELPDEARPLLLQYPGEAPVLAIESVMDFNGNTRVAVKAVEYNGTVRNDTEVYDLVLTGLQASALVSSDLTRIEANLGLGEFMLQGQGAEFRTGGLQTLLSMIGPDLDMSLQLAEINLQYPDADIDLVLRNLTTTADMNRIAPTLWVGIGEAAYENITLDIMGFTGEVNGLSARGVTELTSDNLLDSIMRMEVAGMKVGSESLGRAVFEFSLRNLSQQAYAALNELSRNADPAIAYTSEQLAAAFNLALEAGPHFNIDELSLSVVEENDINAAMSLSYAGQLPLNLEQMDEVINGIVLDATANLSTAAVRQLLRLNLIADDTVSAQELDGAVEQSFQEFISVLSETGLVEISEESITTAIAINGGTVVVNGSPGMTFDEFFAMAGSSMTGGADSAVPPNGPFQTTDTPVFPSEALYENLTLQSGFTPAPRTVSVTAGGEEAALTTLGVDCPGTVFSATPDVSLSFNAGEERSLYVYAESEQDTTIIMYTPDGWYCDDDSHGDFNPGVSIEAPQSGDYLIWLGTYDGGYADAVLGISED